MRRWTIIAITGDNGMEHAIGLFSSRERAEILAARWQEADNPDRWPDGIHYAATPITTVLDWTSQ